MDPFIEGQCWQDFHHWLAIETAAALIRQIRPRYRARVEERIYFVRDDRPDREFVQPDLTIVKERVPAVEGRAGTSTATVSPWVTVPLPAPRRVRELYLEIEALANGEVVAMVEFLSPSNKRSGTSGQHAYLEKRESVLGTTVHLIELDLLRGGVRLPTARPVPKADHYVFISRGDRRPMADVWPIGLRARLPAIPIPLLPEDGEVVLDLQAMFDTVYDRAGYDYALDYTREVEPPLAETDRAWVAEVLAAR